MYQAWGQLHWKVINYITLLWKIAQLYYITITAIFSNFQSNQLYYITFQDVIDYIT